LSVIKQNNAAASFTKRGDVCNGAQAQSRFRDVDAVEFRGLRRVCIRDGHLVAIRHRTYKRREWQPRAVHEIRAELRLVGTPRQHRIELHAGLRNSFISGVELLNLLRRECPAVDTNVVDVSGEVLRVVRSERPM